MAVHPDGALRIPHINAEAVSREEIRAGGERVPGLWEYFVQTTHPGTVQLDGDTASGRAYLQELGRFRDGRRVLPPARSPWIFGLAATLLHYTAMRLAADLRAITERLPVTRRVCGSACAGFVAAVAQRYWQRIRRSGWLLIV